MEPVSYTHLDVYKRQEDTITDQPQRQIVAELIREKALRTLDEEIPHGIAVTIDQMKERTDKDLVDIDATIICERDSHKGIIIGKQGAMLKKIGSAARYEIEHFLEKPVKMCIRDRLYFVVSGKCIFRKLFPCNVQRNYSDRCSGRSGNSSFDQNY